MTPTATHATAALSPSQAAHFRANGYLAVRQLFSSEEVGVISSAFMAASATGPVEGLSETRHPGAPDGYAPTDPLARYPRMMNPHKRSDLPVGPLTRNVMLDPRLGGILRELFDDEVIAGQSMFYFKPPGSRGSDLHQDNFYLRTRPGTCLAAWLAIDDADAANGAMVVIPGTGDLDIVCPEKADQTRFFNTEHVSPPPGKHEQLLAMQSGDVLFFNGNIIHGSYPNTTSDRFRRAMIFHYMPFKCIEVNEWYKPLFLFDGTGVERAPAQSGGPCGAPLPSAPQ